MAEKPEKWDLETEVLVVGSGGGALSAAILAHDNAAAPVRGPSYWGAGGTIGPAMIFGYLAGRHVANKK